jgi:hypothetical protein
MQTNAMANTAGSTTWVADMRHIQFRSRGMFSWTVLVLGAAMHIH